MVGELTLIAVLAGALAAGDGQPAQSSSAPEEPVVAVAAADPMPPEADSAEAVATIPLRDLEARLEALDPANAEAYFLLGEEVAAEIPAAPAARRLAQQLFTLAYEINRARPEPDVALTRSVCLALSATVEGADRRWLLAMARSLDADRPGPDFAAPAPGPSRREAALDLATVLGYVRSGEGRRAEQLLQRSGAGALLDQYEALLRGPGLDVGASTIRRYISQWPSCPECRNRRTTTRAHEGGGTTVLCATCQGNPGPRLTDEEVLLQLRLESALLSGIQRSWAAQVAADSGAPLRDLDPGELAGTLGVDPAKRIWRGGRWVEPEPAEGAAPESTPAPEAAPVQPPAASEPTALGDRP